MAIGRLGLAVLGLLAYQNRDKIGTWLRRQSQPGSPIDNLVAGTGLSDVLQRLRNAGASEQVDSWVSRGENQPLTADQVTRAIDSTTLDELSRQTGLSREELIERITKDLPGAVDGLTPTGQVPPEHDQGTGPNLLDDVPEMPGPKSTAA